MSVVPGLGVHALDSDTGDTPLPGEQQRIFSMNMEEEGEGEREREINKIKVHYIIPTIVSGGLDFKTECYNQKFI